jgi:steroid delta-isomerase-like uncharacterized protein
VRVVEQCLAPDYIDRSPPPGVAPGIEGVKQFIGMLRAAFPDSRTEIEDVIADSDKVVIRWTGHGTNTGPFMGMPPSGKPTTVTGIDIYRVVDGRVVESWTNWDALGLMQQLGVIPP